MYNAPPYQQPGYGAPPQYPSGARFGGRAAARSGGISPMALAVVALATWAVIASSLAFWFYTRPVYAPPPIGPVGGMEIAAAGGDSSEAIRSHLTAAAASGDGQHPWTRCFVDNPDPGISIDINTLVIEPRRIVRGSDLTAYFEAALNNGTIAQGMQLRVDMYRGRALMKSFEVDVCKMAKEQQGIACPIEGPQVFNGKVTETVPRYAFEGDYTMQAMLIDSRRRKLTCVQMDLTIVKG